MTYQEYRSQKNELQNQINELDKEWTKNSCASYGKNIGKYYAMRENNMEFGKITNFNENNADYYCNEVSVDSNGNLYYSDFETYGVDYINNNARFITEDEFYELYDKAVKNLRDKF